MACILAPHDIEIEKASDIVSLFHARRTGPGRWMARCPAHEDRAPSLCIAKGRDGRVLLHCFAGCRTEDLLAAVGLRMRDLFTSPSLSPAQLVLVARNRSERDRAMHRLHKLHASGCDCLHKMDDTIQRLAARLMRAPPEYADGHILARLLHSLFDESRRLEQILTMIEKGFQ
jgi:hypothetical protein